MIQISLQENNNIFWLNTFFIFVTSMLRCKDQSMYKIISEKDFGSFQITTGLCYWLIKRNFIFMWWNTRQNTKTHSILLQWTAINLPLTFDLTKGQIFPNALIKCHIINILSPQLCHLAVWNMIGGLDDEHSNRNP